LSEEKRKRKRGEKGGEKEASLQRTDGSRNFG
jgi:hypothetical protein